MGGVTEINRRKQREHESLQKRNQQLQEIHEYHKGCGENSHAWSCNSSLSAIAKYENQTRECENDDVARWNIRCQTNHQNGRLHKNTKHLDRHQNELHWKRDPWRPENVSPVMFIPVEVGQQENQRRQHHCHPDGTRNVESSQKWNESQKVTEKDEEKDRQ